MCQVIKWHILPLDSYHLLSYTITMDENKIIWLSPKEAAKHLRVSLVTFYRYINQTNNALPAHKISSSNIRINQEELDWWVLNKNMAETIADEGLEHYE